MKTKVVKPRNTVIAFAKFRKAGSMTKSKKSIRRKEKVEFQKLYK